jgi:hypothetical protein
MVDHGLDVKDTEESASGMPGRFTVLDLSRSGHLAAGIAPKVGRR